MDNVYLRDNDPASRLFRYHRLQGQFQWNARRSNFRTRVLRRGILLIVGFLQLPFFLVLAQAELEKDRSFDATMLHITVVGNRYAEETKSLLSAAREFEEQNVFIDSWDRDEPRPATVLPNLPQLNRPAAFLCSAKKCSMPLFTAQELRVATKRFLDGV